MQRKIKRSKRSEMLFLRIFRFGNFQKVAKSRYPEDGAITSTPVNELH